MVQWVKALAIKPEDLSSIPREPHGGKRKPSLANALQLSHVCCVYMCVSVYVCMYVCIKNTCNKTSREIKVFQGITT